MGEIKRRNKHSRADIERSLEILRHRHAQYKSYANGSSDIMSNYAGRSLERPPAVIDDIALISAMVAADLALISEKGGLLSSQSLISKCLEIKLELTKPVSTHDMAFHMEAVAERVQKLVDQITSQTSVEAILERIRNNLKLKQTAESVHTSQMKLLLEVVTPKQIMDAMSDLEERVAAIITDPDQIKAIESAFQDVYKTHFGQ